MAKLLRSDPIAASQIKEYISTSELRELIGLAKEETDTVEEALEFSSLNRDAFVEHFREEVIDDLSADELIEQLSKKKYNKASILAALNEA